MVQRGEQGSVCVCVCVCVCVHYSSHNTHLCSFSTLSYRPPFSMARQSQLSAHPSVGVHLDSTHTTHTIHCIELFHKTRPYCEYTLTYHKHMAYTHKTHYTSHLANSVQTADARTPMYICTYVALLCTCNIGACSLLAYVPISRR